LPEPVRPKAGRFSGEVGLLNCGVETARVIAVTDSHLPARGGGFPTRRCVPRLRRRPAACRSNSETLATPTPHVEAEPVRHSLEKCHLAAYYQCETSSCSAMRFGSICELSNSTSGTSLPRSLPRAAKSYSMTNAGILCSWWDRLRCPCVAPESASIHRWWARVRPRRMPWLRPGRGCDQQSRLPTSLNPSKS